MQDKLIIPSCDGLLDAFNHQQTRYKYDSLCCLTEEAPTLFILALFSYCYQQTQLKSCKSCKCTFKISDFKRYIHYKGGGKSADIVKMLEGLNKLGYYWGDTYYEDAFTVTFSDTRRTAIIESEYFERLHRVMKSISGTYDKWGRKTTTGSPTYTSLIHTSILLDRSKSATEIAIEIVRLIERRGPLTEQEDGHIGFDTLIERCPHLHSRVHGIDTKEKNRIMRVAVEKAIGLLQKESEVYQTFDGLEIWMEGRVVKFKYIRRKLDGQKQSTTFDSDDDGSKP